MGKKGNANVENPQSSKKAKTKARSSNNPMDLYSQIMSDTSDSEEDEVSASKSNPHEKLAKPSKSKQNKPAESITMGRKTDNMPQKVERQFLPGGNAESSESESEANQFEYDDDEDDNVSDDKMEEESVEPSQSDEEEDSNEDSDTDEEEEEEEDTHKTTLRKQLKDLSFEELEALKQKMGLKEYNEAMFGKNSGKRSNKKKGNFERKNKNRPREMSSKVRVPKLRQVVDVAKKVRKDPRFDSACGDYNEQFWNNQYSFIRDIQKNEAADLKKNLKTISDSKQRKDARRFIQKVTDKEKAIAVKERDAQRQMQDKEDNRKRIEEGKRPFYMKKSTKKLVELVEKYDELKASGRLEKYLKKKRKKNAVRDRKSLNPLKKIK